MVENAEIRLNSLAPTYIHHNSGDEIGKGILLLADSLKQYLSVQNLLKVFAHLGKPPIEIGLEGFMSVDGLVVESPVRQVPGFLQSLLILERAVK